MGNISGWELVLRSPYSVWAVAAAFVVVCAVTYWQYRKDTAQLTRFRSGFLFALRALAVALVFLIFLQPILVATSAETTRQGFVVLVDASRSMELPSSQGKTRMDDTNSVLGSDDLERLSQLFDVKVMAFSDQVSEIDEIPDRVEADEHGEATDISAALRQASGAGPSGILLLSDGCWNKGGDPKRQAVSLAGRGIGVHVLAPAEAERPNDISVTDVRCRNTVFLGDSIALQLKMLHSGFTGRQVKVSVVEEGSEIVSEEVTLGSPMLAQSLSMILVPEEPGRHVFRVGVPVQDGEVALDNNFVAFSVDVVEKSLKILIVESEPRWEYRFLRNALERDPSSEVRSVLLRPGIGPMTGKGYLEHFPSSKKELSEYDVIILGDLGSDVLTGFNTENLAEFARARGGGLVVLPGRQHGLIGYTGTKMEDVLPVEILPGSESRGVLSRKPSGLKLTAAGKEHLIARLDTDVAESVWAWEQLSGGAWYCACGDAKRGTKIIVEHPYLRTDRGALPVMAVRQAGNGKVVYIGWDSSWRWRKGVGDKYHYRFWAQLVRWIVKKQFEGDDPFVKLACERNVCEVGEDIFVESYVLDKDYYPLDDAEVYLLLTSKDGLERERIRMKPSGSGWGIYKARVSVREEGDHRLQVVVPHHGPEPRKTELNVTVERPALESKALVPNTALLRQLADITGGAYVRPGGLPEFVDELEERTLSRMRTAEFPIWDSAYLVGLAALILTVEWISRKRWGLS